MILKEKSIYSNDIETQAVSQLNLWLIIEGFLAIKSDKVDFSEKQIRIDSNRIPKISG